ncbi:hypothetical protein Tco_0482295 [Tanacetum coccineum]
MTLDYSSPPLWDDYDDELFDLETDNDDTYDGPFDSKEEKIKDSKILINELDLPGSSDFLPSPECGLVFYVDFSEVDALSSTNNEDKVFNLGILIHKSHFEVTNCATPEKNVKKPTNASLILKDFNPPLDELPFHKQVPGLGALLSALKLSKSLKYLKARWRFFLARVLDVLYLHFYPPLQAQVWGDQAKLSNLKQALRGWQPMLILDFPDFEASHARGFCPSFTRASNPQLYFRESDIQIISTNVYL